MSGAGRRESCSMRSVGSFGERLEEGSPPGRSTMTNACVSSLRHLANQSPTDKTSLAATSRSPTRASARLRLRETLIGGPSTSGRRDFIGRGDTNMTSSYRFPRLSTGEQPKPCYDAIQTETSFSRSAPTRTAPMSTTTPVNSRHWKTEAAGGRGNTAPLVKSPPKRGRSQRGAFLTTRQTSL